MDRFTAWRAASFQFSSDCTLRSEVIDVVVLYLDQVYDGVARCVGEKFQIQASTDSPVTTQGWPSVVQIITSATPFAYFASTSSIYERHMGLDQASTVWS